MSIDELVAVNSLLIERETCLADLSHIESTISDILGQPYPFSGAPVELPSLRKRAAAPKRAATAKSASKPPPRIRRLKPEEFAYRVTTSESGVQSSSDIFDFTPFQDLLANPLPRHRILKVETIDERQNATETLYDSGA